MSYYFCCSLAEVKPNLLCLFARIYLVKFAIVKTNLSLLHVKRENTSLRVTWGFNWFLVEMDLASLSGFRVKVVIALKNRCIHILPSFLSISFMNV